MGIRLLGLASGLCFLASLWLCQNWIGRRAPTLSIALLGGLPAFIFIVAANSAYGLAACLLVLSFGTIWRVLESPTMLRILVAGLLCVPLTKCFFYDVIVLAGNLVTHSIV